ncbi:peptidoglycan DD-metalloendopeptidase family protein [Caminibacter sp.]
MKKIFSLILLFSFIFAYQVETKKWKYKDTFYGFLKENSLPISIYYNLPSKIKRMVRRIPVNSIVFILKDNNDIKQALIPLNDKIQLQIIKKRNKYITKIVPVIYETREKFVSVDIKHYLSYDLYNATHIHSLTSQLINIFEDKINFRLLPKNTTIKILYKEKLLYGKIKGTKIIFASISNPKFTYNAFLNPYDGRYYDEHARSLRGMFLPAPLKYKRISSYFGMRFHPILHKWRMHDGIDYVNRIGTPIHSVADGKIIFKGWIKGYGRAVEIRHKDGYVTLYAHLHGWPRGIYVGKWVRQGQVIGYLGNSGLSTGPHLHFGVMHYGHWINPLKIKNSAKITLWGKKRKEFLSYIKNLETSNKDVALALK